MDYANVAGSPDLHGQSPWGSSSPRASRTSFAPPENPPSPSTPTRDQTTYQPQADSPSDTFSHNTPSGHEQHVEQEQGFPQQQDVYSTQQHQSQQAQQPQQRPSAARYQAARQQRQPPQYKIQAKITALERTGRKDPVLRFDVYVRPSTFYRTVRFIDSMPDQSAEIQDYTISRCPPNTFRIREAGRSSHIIESRSIGSCRSASFDIGRGGHR